MKTLKVPVCLIAGHEWRVSRTVLDHQTCIRCGVRVKIRNPLGRAAAIRTEGSWDDIAAPAEALLEGRQPELESDLEVEAEGAGPILLSDGASAADPDAPANGNAMLTIAVVSRKGGGGKSTLAVHLAIGAHLRGFRTMVADADPQRSVGEVLKLRNGS
ncbi:MAG TPA: ParA family protein, partial [Caulobacteraceae bacterium]|nr:ParA family protein [Caulobacteraceae bacterium]